MSGHGTIVVTPRSLSADGHPALGRLTAAGYDLVFPSPGRVPKPEELRAALPSAVGYLAGTERIDRATLAAAPSLRVIARNGIGTDGVDLAAAAEAGVRVETAAGANAQGVAELAIGLLLTAARRIPWHDHALKLDGWTRSIGLETNGRTLGVVGCGQIGRRVSRMALGLGMRVIAFDAYPDSGFAPGDGFEWVDLDRLLAESDAVTLHAPPAPEGPLIGGNELARLRTGAILVNTARASLVDLDAVWEAVREGRLWSYATDVFDTEPPAPHPLYEHERVIVTPHLGGYTEESVDRAAEAAVDNIIRVLDAPR